MAPAAGSVQLNIAENKLRYASKLLRIRSQPQINSRLIIDDKCGGPRVFVVLAILACIYVRTTPYEYILAELLVVRTTYMYRYVHICVN